VKVIRAYRRMQEALRSGPAAAADGADPQLAATAEKLRLPVERVAPVIEEWMRRRPLGILPRCRRGVVLDAIVALGAAGVPQGVYSDYPPADKLAALGVAECIDVQVWSAQAQVQEYKPSAKGFLRAAELLGAAPAECLYVGDRPEVDGAGAAAAGMRYLDVSEIVSCSLQLTTP
jgi:FMN phosphatase YigB (HAD superfamily)